VSACTLTVLCGLPGSGKSTWGATHAESAEVFTLDDIRTEGADPRSVMRAVVGRARAYLNLRRSVVIDGCALRPSERTSWLTVARAHWARPRIVLFDTPVSVCRARDAARPAGQRFGGDWAQAVKAWDASKSPRVHADFNEVLVVRCT
jgi:protein phosphatase